MRVQDLLLCVHGLSSSDAMEVLEVTQLPVTRNIDGVLCIISTLLIDRNGEPRYFGHAACVDSTICIELIDWIDGPPCTIICEKPVCSTDRDESMPSALITRMGSNVLNEAADIAECANSVMQQMLLWGELPVPLLSLSNPLINGSCYKSSEEAYPHEDNVGVMILSLDVNTVNAASSHCAATMPKFVRVCDNRNKAQLIWPIVASHTMRSYKSKPDGVEISCVQLTNTNCLGVRGFERSEKHRDFEWGALHSNYLAHYMRLKRDALVADASRSDCSIGTTTNISSSYDGHSVSSTSTSPSYALSMTDGIPYHRYHLLGLEHSDSLNNDLAKIAELDSREVFWAEEFNRVLKHGKIGPCNTAMYSWGAIFVVMPMTYAVMSILVITTTYAVTIDDGSLLRITSGYSDNSTTDCGQVFMMDDSLRYQGRQPNHREQSILLRHEEQHADNDITAGNIAVGMMTIDTEVGVTTLCDLEGIDDRYGNFTVQRSTESMDINLSDGCNFDGCMIPPFRIYSNSDASSHNDHINNLMMDRINGSSGWKSRPHFMIEWMDPALLNDDMKRSLSWGAMSNVDESDAWIVDNYSICTCDDDGLIYDMDDGTMLYDTGVDLVCLAADNSTNDRDVIDGTRCLHGTVLDTRFAVDNGFVDTMQSECTGLFYNETLALKDAPIDVGIYAARTTLEKTMIKPTSHCLELLIHGRSASSGYDDPNTAENILPARRRPMFIAPIVDVKLHHDMFSIKPYVVNTHDCLHKCHHTLTHHCTNGTTDSGTGRRKLIAISVEFNYGDILSKNWTSHQAAWMLLGLLIWKHDMIDLAFNLALLGMGLDSPTNHRGVTKDTSFHVGTDSVLLWNLGTLVRLLRYDWKDENTRKRLKCVERRMADFGGKMMEDDPEWVSQDE